MRKLAPFIMALCLLALALPAWADGISPLDIGFSRITGNSSQGDDVKLNLNVSQVDANTMQFTLSNLSGIESVVSEIYFQDLGGMISRYQILNEQNTGKVLFEDGANPGSLPGGNDISFSTSYAMQADNPSPKYGINPNEALVIYVDLGEGVTVATLLAGLNSGNVRIGAHVQSIAGGTSDSYVSGGGGGGEGAPEPGTMALMGSGLLAGWLVRRKRGRKGAKGESA
ncbi:MAG: PEP-CTERM sorting domain-containing protein [Desulfarculaceae bacterium]|nr:PEP-CTERM sorting domain-containing protein [Desulfarculaceae bacterium]MCF8066599.1 PEP-CTERM sorting domain-containing protein [Desulfarculaceae bacterium]MCF8098985.1 PEP-CTERM sorting domain-containing protein [Desulfarculaceae bacterium]MCF8124228.1 PEP-CTERM sorting domain-containing protein [Desulfarculaceae bacterium]